MKIQILIAVACLLLCCSATRHADNDLARLSWLRGTWENNTQKGILYESWTQTSEYEMAAKSYMLKGEDSVLFELMRIVQERGSLAFISTVNNQNNNLPVRFVKMTITDTSVIFINPAHDFPQIISYTKIGQDSLLAEISGMVDTGFKKRSFPMKKQSH
jgi:hypothetical protein